MQFFCLLLIVGFFSGEALPLFAQSQPVFIQKIQISGESKSDELVTLFNPSPEPIDISGWQLRKKAQSTTSEPVSLAAFKKGTIIPGDSAFLWTREDSSFVSVANLVSPTNTSFSLSENNAVALYSGTKATGQLIDSVAWGLGASFDSLAYRFSVNPKDFEQLIRHPSTLAWSLQSPVLPEIILPETGDLQKSLFINEFLPHPIPGQEEFIEFQNTTNTPLPLKDWFLTDASQTGKYTFTEEIVPASGFLVITKSVFGFALNDSNEILTLFDPLERPLQKIQYKKSKIGVSLNKQDANWRGGTPTPGFANILNELPTTREKVPKKGFLEIPVSFHARGSDPEKQSLKFVWDFGDGHKSYKEKTTHTYKKKGSYQVTLTTSDDKDEQVETFTLTIEHYKPPKLRIIAFSPNPKGKDSEHEWIQIENHEKKEVDLKGFSLATGSASDKLVNHPIKETFLLSGKSTATLTRSASLFTLPNQKGRIELQAPNGEVIDKIRYRYEEAKSIPEDTLYEKQPDKTWIWKIRSLTPALPEEAPEDPVEAPSDEKASSQEAAPERSSEEIIALKERLNKALKPSFQQFPEVHTLSLAAATPKEKDPFRSFQSIVNRSLNVLLRPES